ERAEERGEWSNARVIECSNARVLDRSNARLLDFPSPILHPQSPIPEKNCQPEILRLAGFLKEECD
ncbi:MAG: hypothetical protein II462_02970, partial [Muribaculaceae bacterium]|nr:hypothetical protein [Muribaculaceae bacterium]